jgi:DNA-directed RNA polymerase subunit RPC12/RpoP
MYYHVCIQCSCKFYSETRAVECPRCPNHRVLSEASPTLPPWIRHDRNPMATTDEVRRMEADES